jgi:hypothetical protein
MAGPFRRDGEGRPLLLDGASSESLCAERAVAWRLTRAPGAARQVTLTKVDMIKF